MIRIFRSFIKRQTSGTSSGNEWQRVIQPVATSDNKWYNEWQRVTTNDKGWQRVVQQVIANDSRWQRVTRNDNGWYNEWPFRLIFLFFQIREEPTTKHPQENSLNLEDDLWFFNWIKSRNKHPRRHINIKKQELQKQLFADFHQNKCS